MGLGANDTTSECHGFVAGSWWKLGHMRVTWGTHFLGANTAARAEAGVSRSLFQWLYYAYIVPKKKKNLE